MICGGSVVEAMVPLGCPYSENEILELFVLGQLVEITDQQLRSGQQSLGLWVGFSWGPHEGHCHGSFGRSRFSVSVHESVSANTGVHEIQDETREDQMAPGPMARKRRAECQTLSPDVQISPPCVAPEQRSVP